ncbi:hypothetical protein [Caldalkalibacillus salinus]|uniref:hypothetical protein n=1 Tax=Caldalkalibacillus salinus TaxID=2803787 RepID=UPI00192194C1|nr:hypothetical protein [Caldalkalibacillus salinus]
MGNTNHRILKAVKYVSLIVLICGIFTFLFGLFGTHSTLVPISIGMMTGAIFIFIIGTFFVVTEEVLKNQ